MHVCEKRTVEVNFIFLVQVPFDKSTSMTTSFPRVGSEDPSNSSKKMQEKTMKHLIPFLQSKGLGAWETLSTEQVTIELVQEFAGYCCYEAEKQDGELFAWETVSKFISGFNTLCLTDIRFKDQPMWKEANANW